MPVSPQRFERNDIMSLTERPVRHDLAESVGPDLRLHELMDESSALELDLGYGTPAGDSALREAIARRHGVAADDVVVTVGGMHALFLLAFVLCEPGDEAVTTAPIFPNTRAALDSVRATVRVLRLDFAHDYRVDPEALRALLSPATKLVSLATPQNPSGVAVDAATIDGVLAAMDSTCPDAYLVLDETYREAAYGDTPVAPSFAGHDSRIVSCASLSKCHGAPGLRVGWAIARDAALREQLVRGKFATVICHSRIDERLALRALERAETILATRRQHLASARQRVARWVASREGAVRWVAPDAGALCCIRLDPGNYDDAAVRRFTSLQAAHDVRVAPGTWFADEARVFRLGFGLLPLPNLDAALTALGIALDEALEPADGVAR